MDRVEMTRTNIKRSIAALCFFIILAFLLFHGGCTMDGEMRLRVVDEKGMELNDILVIPLYVRSIGIGIGPDGVGPRTPVKLVITRPFIFNSGEELLSHKIPTRGIMLYPVGFFHSNNVYTWLFVKKGFAPMYFSQGDIFGGDSVVMSTADTNEVAQVIDMLLAPAYDQNNLKRTFRTDWMTEKLTVSFDEKETELLKSYR